MSKWKTATIPIILAVVLTLSGCAATLAAGAAGGAAGGAVESAKASETENYGPGTYAGTVLSNVLYFPAKALFAGLGAVTSGGAYLVTLGDRETTSDIWNASVRGDYLVTPSMIEGNRPIHFVGPSSEYRARMKP